MAREIITKGPHVGEGVDLSDDGVEFIKKEYQKQLVIPDNKLLPQFVLCPIGIVGSGKTTVVTKLAERFSMVRISGDEIRKLLKERGFNWKKIYDVSLALITRYLDLGYRVAIDSDCASPKVKEKIRETQALHGVSVVWIHVNPPEEFIINKLRRYQHSWLFADADHAIENYHARKSLHDNPDFPFVYTFDTSRDDLEKQIDEAVEKISKVLLKN